MNEEDMFKTHPDLEDVKNSVHRSWFEVADVMAEATFKVTGVWQDPQENFWHENSTLLQSISKEDAQKIMDMSEAIHERRREINSQESKKNILRAIGRGIVKGLRISGSGGRLN